MRFFVFLLMLFCVWGCGDEALSPQVLEIVSPAESVVSAPPESVWDGIRLNQRYFPREAGFEAEQRAFYTKYVDADGIAILSHAEVADTHLIEARRVVMLMTAKFPALRVRLRVRHGFYMILYAFDPVTGANPGVPEFVRGPRNSCRVTYSTLGGGGVNGYCTAAVNYDFGRMRTFVHEFAHALDSEMERLSPGFVDRVREAYREALASGTWRGEYAETNASEYWAEGVAFWLYDIGPGRWFASYDAFFERDPLLAALLDEWFPRVSLPRHY